MPAIVTYSALIDACEKSKDLAIALQLFSGLQHQRNDAEIFTYNGMINACEKG